MKPTWFIESYGQERIEEFEASVKRAGSNLISGRSCMYENFDEILSREECFVYYGSLEFAREVRRKAKWIPGVYCNLEQFKCSTYYPYYYGLLLCDNYLMMPFGDLLNRKNFLYNTLGNGECIFVRPDTGFKLFTGQVIYEPEFEKQMDRMGFYDVPKDTICVVAEPVNIIDEWRLFIVDNKVVTGSLYKKEGGNITERIDSDSEAWKFAQEHVGIYTPEKAWVMDVCTTTDRGMKILELNSFSCSGIYDCDTDAVVEAVNKIAMEEWAEYQE